MRFPFGSSWFVRRREKTGSRRGALFKPIIFSGFLRIPEKRQTRKASTDQPVGL